MTETNTICQNCGSPLSGHFCTNCGQKNTDKNVSLKIMLEDLFSDVFRVDSKIIRSISPLLFKPGSLSLDYSKGKRDSYVKPFRLYLFSSLLFFFFAFLNITPSDEGEKAVNSLLADTSFTYSPEDTLDSNGNLVIHMRGSGIGLSYYPSLGLL